MTFQRSSEVNDLQRSHQATAMTVVLAVAALAFSCGTTIADPDLWGHTLYGLRAAELGVLAEPVDPFSYTAPGQVWINHEWLTEYQFGWLWKRCGEAGLWIWRTLAAGAVFGVGVWTLRKANASLGATILLLTFTAETLSTYFIFIRPQLATFALFAITLCLLRQHWERPTWKWLAPLPFIMALWVNLHGGFLAGAAIVVLFFVAWCVRATQNHDARSALVAFTFAALLAALATLVNPYGPQMLTMLWDHLVPEQAVNEWQPLWVAKQQLVYYIPLFLVRKRLAGGRAATNFGMSF